MDQFCAIVCTDPKYAEIRAALQSEGDAGDILADEAQAYTEIETEVSRIFGITNG
jgi:hypothetical protein